MRAKSGIRADDQVAIHNPKLGRQFRIPGAWLKVIGVDAVRNHLRVSQFQFPGRFGKRHHQLRNVDIERGRAIKGPVVNRVPADRLHRVARADDLGLPAMERAPIKRDPMIARAVAVNNLEGKPPINPVERAHAGKQGKKFLETAGKVQVKNQIAVLSRQGN